MRDPMVAVFEVRSPLPTRSAFYDAEPGRPRWRWSPPFATAAGKGVYWPTLATVWHVEPDGKKPGSVCKRHRTDGRWSRAWHVHHWKVTVPPARRVYRWLFDRCAGCDGRFRWSGGRFGYELSDRVWHGECMHLRSVRAHLDDADALAARMLATLSGGMESTDALEWFRDAQDPPVWRAVARLRKKLGSAE